MQTNGEFSGFGSRMISTELESKHTKNLLAGPPDVFTNRYLESWATSDNII